MASPEPVAPSAGVVPDAVDEWDDDQRLAGEKETLGLFLTGHPIDFYAADLRNLAGTRIARLSLDDVREPRGRRGGKKVTVAGMVVAVSRRNTQRGTMASVLLDDKSGRIEAALFSETYERFRNEIVNDRVLVVQGTLVHDEYRGGLSIRADAVRGLEDVRIARARRLEVAVREEWVRQRGQSAADAVAALRGMLESASGGHCEVRIRYCRSDAEVRMQLGKAWTIRPSDAFLRQVRRLLGADAVTLRLGPAASEAADPPHDYA
jgi:DNA polymerase-3 subunit alpha